MRAIGLATLLVTVLLLGGCGKARSQCDIDRLEQRVSALEAQASPHANDAAKALREACSSVPRELPERIVCDLEPMEPETCMALGAPPRLSASACADVTAMAKALSGPAEGRARGYFEACGLARHGVLDPGEHFYRSEHRVYQAVAWMTDHGAQPPLARRFARTILHATAPVPVLLRRCGDAVGDDACWALLRKYSIEAPLAAHGEPMPRSRAARIMIAPDVLVLDGHEIGTVLAAEPNPTAGQPHVIEPLRAALERSYSPPLSDGERPVVELWVDRNVPLGTVIDVLHTVAQVGPSEVAFVVADREDPSMLQTVAVSTPPRWSKLEPRRYAKQPHRVTVQDDRVVFDEAGPGSSTSVAYDARDEAAIMQSVRRRAELWPTSPYLLLARRDVLISEVIAVLGTLRGGVDDGYDAGRVMYLDQIPAVPTSWNRSNLTIGPGVQRNAAGDVRRIRPWLERSLPDLEACARRSHVLGYADTDHIEVAWPADVPVATSMQAEAADVSDCFREAFAAPESLRLRSRVEFWLMVETPADVAP